MRLIWYVLNCTYECVVYTVWQRLSYGNSQSIMDVYIQTCMQYVAPRGNICSQIAFIDKTCSSSKSDSFQTKFDVRTDLLMVRTYGMLVVRIYECVRTYLRTLCFLRSLLPWLNAPKFAKAGGGERIFSSPYVRTYVRMFVARAVKRICRPQHSDNKRFIRL